MSFIVEVSVEFNTTLNATLKSTNLDTLTMVELYTLLSLLVLQSYSTTLKTNSNYTVHVEIKSPNKFTLKAGIRELNEIYMPEGC